MGPLCSGTPSVFIMAFKLLVVATLVAVASAGFDPAYMMKMMEMMKEHEKEQEMKVPVGQGCEGGACKVPAGVDIAAYMEQQKQAQQFEQQQMAEKIKAQFEGVMAEVTMKKHRYAMSVMTEFTTMCACLKESYTIYQSMFVETARAANMTDVIDLDQEAQKMPYEAASLKEAKERIFGGMLYSICGALGTYMDFATQVENNINLITPGVTPAPGK